jgi:hypothetical protein
LLDQEGICASSGLACLADSDEPSHVVKAMKPDSTASRQMIRFSLDLANSAAGAHQQLTRQWWQDQRSAYQCLVSDEVLREAERGLTLPEICTPDRTWRTLNHEVEPDPRRSLADQR